MLIDFSFPSLLLLSYVFVCFSRSNALVFCILFSYVFYLWETDSFKKLIWESSSLLEVWVEGHGLWVTHNSKADIVTISLLFIVFGSTWNYVSLIFSFPPVSHYVYCSFRHSHDRFYYLYIFYLSLKLLPFKLLSSLLCFVKVSERQQEKNRMKTRMDFHVPWTG